VGPWKYSASAAAAVSCSPDRRRIPFVGKLIARKRPFDLLHIVARRADRSLEAAFVGSLGFVNQSELPAVYATADLLVLPFDAEETWGLVVSEAMACGIPAVASDAVGCAPDLVDAGSTGALFPFSDVAALLAAIEGVLSLNRPQVRRRLADKMALYSALQPSSSGSDNRGAWRQ
jgi:hypothetical protein